MSQTVTCPCHRMPWLGSSQEQMITSQSRQNHPRVRQWVNSDLHSYLQCDFLSNIPPKWQYSGRKKLPVSRAQQGRPGEGRGFLRYSNPFSWQRLRPSMLLETMDVSCLWVSVWGCAHHTIVMSSVTHGKNLDKGNMRPDEFFVISSKSKITSK